MGRRFKELEGGSDGLPPRGMRTLDALGAVCLCWCPHFFLPGSASAMEGFSSLTPGESSVLDETRQVF